MNQTFVLLLAVLAVAFVFDFSNGFHDTANAIATVVGTKVLPLWVAIAGATFFNFVGAFFGTAVAKSVGTDVIDAEKATQLVIFSALVGAIVWNFLTLWQGIPSSSSHALFGGLVGAAWVSSGMGAVKWGGLANIGMALVITPFVGFLFATIAIIAVRHAFNGRSPGFVHRASHWLQLLSAGFMALSHGMNDAQKTMGIMAVALESARLVVRDEHGHLPIPTWVVWLSAVAMASGTACGGRAIIKTLATKIVELRPIQGFAAETSSALVIIFASLAGRPVSTTHIISGSIYGVGSVEDLPNVFWAKAWSIGQTWVLTMPASGAMAALVYFLLSWIIA